MAMLTLFVLYTSTYFTYFVASLFQKRTAPAFLNKLLKSKKIMQNTNDLLSNDREQ